LLHEGFVAQTFCKALIFKGLHKFQSKNKFNKIKLLGIYATRPDSEIEKAPAVIVAIYSILQHSKL